MFKFFIINNTTNIDEVKKQYKKLAFQFHPDLEHGDLETMKAINNEYELALKEIGKTNNKNYILDEEFINIIDALIKLRMRNVTIEICGWFIYISGNTKPYKAELKALKLFWNNKKICWYYKPDWYSKKSRDSWSMDRIRNTWGSQQVHNRTEQQDSITA